MNKACTKNTNLGYVTNWNECSTTISLQTIPNWLGMHQKTDGSPREMARNSDQEPATWQWETLYQWIYVNIMERFMWDFPAMLDDTGGYDSLTHLLNLECIVHFQCSKTRRRERKTLSDQTFLQVETSQRFSATTAIFQEGLLMGTEHQKSSQVPKRDLGWTWHGDCRSRFLCPLLCPT